MDAAHILVAPPKPLNQRGGGPALKPIKSDSWPQRHKKTTSPGQLALRLQTGGRCRPACCHLLMDAPLSLTRPKRAAASATVVKIGQSLREQDSTITEARTNPSALPVVAKRAKRVWDCEQGRQRNRGSGFCEHGRERSRCKECGGVGVCEHGRRRSFCKDCGGMGLCEHGRRRGRTARTAAARRSASTRSGVIPARTASGRASASTGGSGANARTAAGRVSASTVGGGTVALSAVGTGSASTVSGGAVARSAAAAQPGPLGRCNKHKQ